MCLSVCLSTERFPYGHYPWCIGHDCTGSDGPINSLEMGPHCTRITAQGSPLLVTSGGQDWRSVQTCSLEDPLVLTSVGYWSPYGRQAGATHPTRMPSFLQRVLTLLEVDSSLEMECLSRLVPASCGEPSREEEECFSRMVGEPSREPCDHSRSPLTGKSSRRTLAMTSSFEPWCFSLTEPGNTRNNVHLVSTLVYSCWMHSQ